MNVGDIVEVDGQVGRVVNITLRTTRCKSRKQGVNYTQSQVFNVHIIQLD